MGTFATYEGNIVIPEEKKDEFNKNMIKLLQIGGMVNFDEVSLYGNKITLISPVELGQDGKCSFHYNYFEDDPWESAGFDSNTNCLWSEKIGSDEFNFVICAAYFLIELYSSEIGWVSENGNILYYPDYVQWINFILDKDFSLEKRFNLWKLYEAYVLNKLDYGYEPSEIQYEEVFDFIPKGLEEYMGGTEFADILYIENGTEEIDGDVALGAYAKDLSYLKKKLQEFFEANPNEGKDVIWELITKPLENRKNIKGTNYDELAIISTKIAARVYVYLSAELLGFSFWEEWKKIYKDVYADEIEPQYVSAEVLAKREHFRSVSLGKIKTSQFLRNDGYFTFYDTPEEIKHKKNYYISDDDLMYWWDGTEKVKLSEKMNTVIAKWKSDFDEIKSSITEEDIRNYDMVKNLISTLKSADDFYCRIFAFNTMFYEFLENSHEINYVVAVKLLEKIIEDKKEEGRIIEYAKSSWDLTSKNVTFNEGRVTIKRFLSLMANQKLRGQYFGF